MSVCQQGMNHAMLPRAHFSSPRVLCYTLRAGGCSCVDCELQKVSSEESAVSMEMPRSFRAELGWLIYIEDTQIKERFMSTSYIGNEIKTAWIYIR
jgi:hypothetical protein